MHGKKEGLKMKKDIRALAASSALAFSVACAVPTLAYATEAPSGVDSVDAAITWANSYLDDSPSLLSAEGGNGWELLATDAGAWDLEEVTADTSWYSAGAKSYTISSGSQLMGLAQLVNAGTDFSGKTITLASDVVFIRTDITIIGDANHPFNGTFDGGGHSIRGYSYTTTADAGERAENIALFGACGKDSLIKNVSVSGATITVARSAASAQAVTGVAALVANTQGSVENCTVDASVNVRVDTPQTASLFSVINNVGGVAGYVGGDIKNCTFKGSVTACTNTAGSDATDGNGRSPGLVVAQHIGGVAAACAGDISKCGFFGSIDAQSPCEAGVDRFGEAISAKTEAVGGVVGYTDGSVADSFTNGKVYAPQGTMVGGVVGSLRSISIGGLGDATTMDNGKADDVLSISRCYATKAASVEGLHAGGGIVGAAGSYTTVTECYNQGSVQVDRWNKPSGGGIAGQTHAIISYCYNTGEVTTKTGGGYYVAGIAGMMLFYKEADGTPNTPTPEVYGCYNSGKVNALQGMKSAGIVGQNDGYIHDCLLLKGTVIDGDAIFQVDDGSSGTVSNCTSVSTADLKSTTSVATLNLLRNKDGWGNYFIAGESANNGYPQLKTFAADRTTTKLANVTASCTTPASYTGGDAVPGLKVVMNGKELVQNADYYVVPQKGATNLGGNYRASIVGIGDYSGELSSVCSYTIAKGDLSTCSVSIKAQTFDYAAKKISADDIVVTDSMGNTLPSTWFTFKFQTCTYDSSKNGNKYPEYNGRTLNVRYASSDIKNAPNLTLTDPRWSEGVVHYGYYPVDITATSSSPYTGTVTGVFKVTPASLMKSTVSTTENDIDIEGMAWNGKTYTWNDDADAFENGAPVIDYTGSEIKPSVPTITYKGRKLVEGQDYMVIYGNPNSDTDASSNASANVGSADTNTVACATVRFIGGGHPSDFTNFVNMYFVIHGQNAEAAKSIESCTIVANDQAYTGKDLTPVKVYAPDGTELKGENYHVEYKNNTKIGTATFTVRGTREYAGTATGSFTIYDKADALGYDDVNPADWYVKDGTLKFCKESGLIKGINDTTFLPYGELTRAQLATILWRFADSKAAEANDPATAVNETGIADVASHEWYTNAVNWAFKNGIITGYKNDDGSIRAFGPDDPVTREQVCVILRNYAESQNKADVDASTDLSKLDAMPDGASVSTWARKGVAWALGQGAISGVDNNGVRYVDPARSIYRCEMGAIMKNCTSDNDIIMPPTVTLQEAAVESAPAADDAATSGAQAPAGDATANAAPEAAADASVAGAEASTPSTATTDPKED